MAQRGLKSYVSFNVEDILSLPQFSHIPTRFDLIKRENDELVKEVLYRVGANKDVDFDIQACYHKKFDGSYVVDYRYIFEERSDKEWLSSRFCNIEANIAAQKDMQLKGDMVAASQQGIGKAGWDAMVLHSMGKDGTVSRAKSEIMEDYEQNVAMIKALQEVQEQIRGVVKFDENVFNKGV